MLTRGAESSWKVKLEEEEKSVLLLTLEYPSCGILGETDQEQR